MCPIRNDLDPWVKRNSPLCGYCRNSNDQIPDEKQRGLGRLWCEKRQRIVMEDEKAQGCEDYNI